VSRLNDRVNYKVLKTLSIKSTAQKSSLKILNDCQIQLFNNKHHPTQSFLRLINAKDEKSKKKLLFITNIELMKLLPFINNDGI
jgi:hypothetical protein